MRTLRTSRFGRAAMAMAGSGALIGGVIVAAAAPVSASTLTCGTTITTSVTLTGNLDCTSDTADDGIVIGASDVTVNLNGYSILGPGDSAGTEGIVDDPGGQGTAFDNVVIEGGSISNFVTDIDIEGNYTTPQASSSPSCNTYLPGAIVKNVKTTDDTLEGSAAVYGDCLSDAYIHHLSITDADTGVELDYSESSKVNYSHLNSPFEGLYDNGGTDNIWAHNVINNVNYNGIEAYDTAGALIKGNTVSGSGADGVDEYDGSTDTTIINNTLNDLYFGVFQDDSSDGTVTTNKGSDDAWGLLAEHTTSETYTSNQFNKNQYGIETDFPTGEVLESNVTNHNADVGVFVYTEDNPSYSATLNDNTANDNRFGMDSDIPTSGSGNTATGNKVTNCTNVTCTV